MPRRHLSLNIMKTQCNEFTLRPNNVGRTSMQCYDVFFTSIQGCFDGMRLHRPWAIGQH